MKEIKTLQDLTDILEDVIGECPRKFTEDEIREAFEIALTVWKH